MLSCEASQRQRMENDVWRGGGIFSRLFLHEPIGCGGGRVDAVYFIWCMLSAMCRIVCSHRLAALISSPRRGVLYKPQHQHSSQWRLLQWRGEESSGCQGKGERQGERKGEEKRAWLGDGRGLERRWGKMKSKRRLKGKRSGEEKERRGKWRRKGEVRR